MWYGVVGIIAFIAGLWIGIYLGRNKCRPLPSYTERLAAVKHDCEKQIALLQSTVKVTEKMTESTIHSIELQEDAKIDEIRAKTNLKIEEQKRILEQNVSAERECLTSNITALRTELEVLKKSKESELAAFQEWQASLNNRKKNEIRFKRYEVKAELNILEKELADRKLQIAEQVEAIELLLSTWSRAERLAYEEREGRINAEERNKLALSDRAIAELRELYGACGKLSLSNPLPLYKAIYDVYLKGVVKDLTTRVVGGTKCGIYRIWNVESGKVYIGQSVDIAERWKQHIKRGTKCEVGTLVGASLYESMWDDGIWNFRFEVLEECEKSMLNEREKFWISYFSSNDIGYNRTKGNGQ